MIDCCTTTFAGMQGMHQEKWSDYIDLLFCWLLFFPVFFFILSVLLLVLLAVVVYLGRLRPPPQYRSRSQLIWPFDSVSNYRTYPSYWFHAADLAERYDSLRDPSFWGRPAGQ